jgi:hypothetical protein
MLLDHNEIRTCIDTALNQPAIPGRNWTEDELVTAARIYDINIVVFAFGFGNDDHYQFIPAGGLEDEAYDGMVHDFSKLAMYLLTLPLLAYTIPLAQF